MAEGLHVPVIPLGEMVFNAGTAALLQKVNVVSKSGTMVSVTVTARVTEDAHWFESGVKT